MMPPLCLSCVDRWYEQAIAVVARARELAPRAHLSWFQQDLLVLLQRRKAQLPTGSKRQAYWLSLRDGPPVELRVAAKTRNT